MESDKSFYKRLVNEENMFLFFCCGIAITLIFWILLNSILSIAFFAYWLFFTKKEFSWKLPRSRYVLLFCLLYIIVLIGSLYSSNLDAAVSKVQQKSALLFFPIILGTSVVINAKIFKTTFRVFVLSVLAGCFICIGFGFYKYLNTGQVEHLYGYNLIILKGMSPYTFNLCTLFAILFLIHSIYLKSSHKTISALKNIFPELLIILFLILFLLLVGNRNILAITLFIGLFYSIKLLDLWWQKLLTILMMLFIFAVAIAVNPYLNKQWNELKDFSQVNTIQLDDDASLGRSWGGKQLRMALWTCSWDVIKQNWLTGVGTGDAQDELQQAYEKRQFYFASRYNRYNTHNQYLQEAVTFGIIGLSVFLACLVIPLFAKIYPNYKLFYSLFIFSFAIACITDTPLDLNKGIILYSFFNSLIFFTYYNFKDKN